MKTHTVNQDRIASAEMFTWISQSNTRAGVFLGLFVQLLLRGLPSLVSLAQLLNTWVALIHPFRITDSVNNSPVIISAEEAMFPSTTFCWLVG